VDASVATEIEASLQSDPKLAELVRRLVDALHPERIYLFGSRARGDHRPDSDYDVLVLLEHCDEELFFLERAAYQRLIGIGVPVDVLVMAPSFFDRRQIVPTSLPGRVAREGRVVYVA